jgi:hypothetical protein
VDDKQCEDPKVRLRSEVELAAQASGLADLCAALEVTGVPFFLSGGTLLGAARDGDFIRWDWDVEVSVRTEDLAGRVDVLIDRLTQRGFVIAIRDDAPDNMKLVSERDGALFELQGYRLEGRYRTRREYRTQQRFFEQAAEIRLRGRSYPCMGPVDEYLTDRYGDWRTPLRTADKSAYLNPSYFRRPARSRHARSLLLALRRRIGRYRLKR